MVWCWGYATLTGATVIKDGMAELKKALADLVTKKVLVGVPASESMRDDGSPITNAELAYIHTFGGAIQVPAHQTTIYRLIDNEGDFLKGGRFVRKSISNYATTDIVPAHTVHIPPRAFLEEGIRDNQDEINKFLGKAAQAALNGDQSAVINNLHAAGLSGQNGARNKILTGPFIPLAKSTIRNRLARGRTGTKPLNDSGGLRNSITYVIRDNNGST